MEQARVGSQGDQLVTDQWILSRLRANLGRDAIPWRNPKAVIGTILTRSGEYVKEEPGKYRRVAEK